MPQPLEELKRLLIEGQKRSGQGSYERRSPAAAAIPFLLQARQGLTEFVRSKQDEAESWRLLSQAEECLLNYVAAEAALTRAITLSPTKDRKDLKRMAMLKECVSEWQALDLTPVQLVSLGDHVEKRLASTGCDHTLRWTKEWIKGSGGSKAKGLLEALRNRGGFCDCEVLANVVSE